MDTLKTAVERIMPISQADFELILPLVKFVKLKKKAHLLEQGQVCKNVYFLTRGFLRMYYVDLEGTERNYRFTSENNFLVDFQSFLTQQPSRYYWQAMKDAELIAFSYNDIQTLYSKCIAWERFGRLMAENVYKQLNQRVEMLQFLTPGERYLQLMDLHPELFKQVSLFHIASYLGIKPESLSRLRKRLQKK